MVNYFLAYLTVKHNFLNFYNISTIRFIKSFRDFVNNSANDLFPYYASQISQEIICQFSQDLHIKIMFFIMQNITIQLGQLITKRYSNLTKDINTKSTITGVYFSFTSSPIIIYRSKELLFIRCDYFE